MNVTTDATPTELRKHLHIASEAYASGDLDELANHLGNASRITGILRRKRDEATVQRELARIMAAGAAPDETPEP